MATRLRTFAADDPQIADCAGASLMASIEDWDSTFLADLVAEATGDEDLLHETLLQLDVSRRLAAIAAVVLN